MNESERVICAAVYRDGTTYIGYRHPDAIKKAVECGCAFPIRNSEQGFYTTEKRYITREVAYELAKRTGQILPDSHDENGILYSENLY